MRHFTDLKVLLSNDPVAAVANFDSLVQKEEDDDKIQEVCQIMANYIRNSSVYKRKLIYSELQRSSLLCRLYLSFRFHSFADTMFPRRLILKGRSIFEGTIRRDSHRRHHVIAVGCNRFFNLGVQSDGSPVDEPRLVCLPPNITRIEMTNTHTVFLTDDNRLFGCGKASAFVPTCKKETDSGYVALPSEIEIPGVSPDDKVTDIRVTEGGTMFVIGWKYYHIGKSSYHSASQQIASNCFFSKEPLNLPATTYQTAHVPFDGNRVTIYIALINDSLYWDRSPLFNAKKEIALIVNGFPEHSFFNHFRVLDDGTIYGAKNGLLKGKLKFWKNLDDGFTVKNGTVMEHFDTKYTLMALMEEVPGSIGTEFFAVSPDGLNLVMKMGYQNEKLSDAEEKRDYMSLRVHEMLWDRQEKDPVDIPLDLELCFHEKNGDVIVLETNSLIFNMMFPELKDKIKDNEVQFPYISPFGFGLETEVDLRKYAFDINLDNPRKLSPPTDPKFEFVPEGTDPQLIWYLVTTDNIKIPCHKYLLLVHSRQVVAMQRFQQNLTYGSYQLEESVEQSVEIIAESSAIIVRNALRGILNAATLFELKTIELIECINFYDYHMMSEMFEDAFHVLMETITEFTLPLLYEVFHSFDKNVIEGLVERPYLIFNSISSVIPPRNLLVQFAVAMGNCRTRGSNRHVTLTNFDPKDVVKYYLDLDEDSEDVVWRSIHEDFEGALDPWKREAMRIKEERKTARGRNNSHTYRPETAKDSMTSAPIPIGAGALRNSFSESVGSPVQSPLAFSMSPLTKSLPMRQIRSDSISNSLEDFPEMSCSLSSANTPTSSKIKSPGGRFAPKGARFVKANQMLKPLPAANPWKVTRNSIQEESGAVEPIDFNEVIHKEEKLQKNIRTGFKVIRRLQDIQLEQTAAVELLELYRRELEDDSLVCVELVLTDEFDGENEQIVWGNMPGLIRR